MIYIKKGNPPGSLILYRKQKHAYYGGYKEKDDIREQLLREQGYLCAYCMRRISKDQMKIEHWYPESHMTDDECLDYYNMLGCCPGHNDGEDGSKDTCDTRKGDIVIGIDPRKPEHISRIDYESKSGKITSDEQEMKVNFVSADGRAFSDITTFKKDLTVTLNLNSPAHHLPENRKQALDTLKDVLIKKKKQGQWNQAMLNKLIQKYSTPDENGHLPEYAGIML